MGARRNLGRLTVTTLFAVLIASVAFAQNDSPKRVLLVYQSDGAVPVSVAFEQSLAQSLRAAMGPTMEFYSEQLDSIRFPEYTQRKITELQSQYAKRKIDLVIFFFGSPMPEILPGVPVVQVSNSASDPTVGSFRRANVVQVLFSIDARKIIDAARRLQPKSRRVLLISGTDTAERALLTRFHE